MGRRRRWQSGFRLGRGNGQVGGGYIGHSVQGNRSLVWFPNRWIKQSAVQIIVAQTKSGVIVDRKLKIYNNYTKHTMLGAGMQQKRC